MAKDFLDCGICDELMDIVTETPCCHHCYCKKCIENWLAKKPECPECRKPLTIAICLPNVPFQRMIDNQSVQCPNAPKGCDSKLTRGIVQGHQVKCDFALVVCRQGCKAEDLLRKDQVEHELKFCELRLVNCEQECKRQIAFRLLKTHYAEECIESEVECLNQCGTRFKRKDMFSHANSVCPLQLVECGFGIYGCSAKIMRRVMDEHVNTAMPDHLALITAALHDKQRELEASSAVYASEVSRLVEQNRRFAFAMQQLALLKPRLVYSPLYHLPVILPSRLLENVDKVIEISAGLTCTYRDLTRRSGIFTGGTFAGGTRKNNDNVSLIRSNHPVPFSTLTYYFEMTVENLGKNSAIGIGFAVANAATDAMPGWKPNTFGYHGDDGKKFRVEETSGHGEFYGPIWKVGDVIGCGWNQATGEMFFTHNGKNLGVAFKDIKPTPPLLAQGEQDWTGIGLGVPGDNSAGPAKDNNPLETKDEKSETGGAGAGAGAGVGTAGAGGAVLEKSPSPEDEALMILRFKPGNTLQLELYPVIGFHSPGARVKANFGDQRFKYDIHGSLKTGDSVDGRPQPPMCRFASKGAECALAKSSREHLYQFRHECPGKKDCPLTPLDPTHALLWTHDSDQKRDV